MKSIEIDNLGDVEHLTIPIPEDGGVVVLRGRNGSGKTTTLKAVDRLVTGKKDIDLSAKDGTARGEVSGFGVTLRVARSVTRTGELECESLDGRLSVAELVDPGLKGAEEADAKRIRALVQLAGVQPDVNMFRPLFEDGVTFDEIVKGKALETDDILVLADRIKRAIEEAARNAEGVANIEKSKADACKEASDGIDTSVLTNDAVLQAMLETALRCEQDLKTKAEQAEKRNAEVAHARRRIEQLSLGDVAPSVAECEARVRQCEGEYNAQLEVIRQLEASLADAKNKKANLSDRWNDALLARESNKNHHEYVASLQGAITDGELPSPTAEQLQESSDCVANCRASIEAGVLARRALEQIKKGKQHRSKENEATIRAVSLRESAKRIDDVLSEQIKKLGVPLQVKNSRLVTKTKRGVIPYAELSEGERWKMGLDIAIEAVGPKGLLTINQEAYESLDPQNRKLIREHVEGRGVVILTAEATDGPIRAEIES